MHTFGSPFVLDVVISALDQPENLVSRVSVAPKTSLRWSKNLVFLKPGSEASGNDLFENVPNCTCEAYRSM